MGHEVVHVSLKADLTKVKAPIPWGVAAGMTIVMGIQHELLARGYIAKVAPKTRRFSPYLEIQNSLPARCRNNGRILIRAQTTFDGTGVAHAPKIPVGYRAKRQLLRDVSFYHTSPSCRAGDTLAADCSEVASGEGLPPLVVASTASVSAS